MRHDLTVEDVALLESVEQGHVHHDPNFAGDFEEVPGEVGAHRIGHRLGKLQGWTEQEALVCLADEADPRGVRRYQLTPNGQTVLDCARDAIRAAAVDAVDQVPGGDR